MRRRVPILLLVGAAILAAACRTAPVHDVSASLEAPRPLTLEEVAQAITRAGGRLGWRIEPVAPGQLTGTLRLRKHVAVVAITHDTSAFKIAYKDSLNLRYDGRTIHRNYNTWVENLEGAIRREIAGLVKA